jgi:hypothetical protein
MPILLFPSGRHGALKAALIAARAELATEKANAVAIDAELAHARVVTSAALRECKCISTYDSAITRSVSAHSTAAEFSTIVQHR